MNLNNYNCKVLKIVLILLEQQCTVQKTTTIMITSQRNNIVGMTFIMAFSRQSIQLKRTRLEHNDSLTHSYMFLSKITPCFNELVSVIQ